MAKRLTEEMVIARSKNTDLSKVKRLNCWGSDLVDVSILRKMPAVEILSLSINKINSLEDFVQCKRLEELFIRQNDIQDLNQVMYLQNLPNLKNLWLGENPCTKFDGYRSAVLRALPQLEILDNIAVTADELRDAQRKGRPLVHPDAQESEEDVYVPNTQYSRYQEYQQSEPVVEYNPQRSPSRQDQENETNEEAAEKVVSSSTQEEAPSEDAPPAYSPPRQMSPPRRQVAAEVVRRNYSPDSEYTERRRSSYEPLSKPPLPQQSYEKSSSTNFTEEPVENHYREPRLVSSQSTTNIKEYTNGERYHHARNAYSRDDGSEIGYGRAEGPVRSASQHNCSIAHKLPFQRRPVTRNSNILSAVLCLVKELDYPSLEVVEVAVRCRMDELDE